MVRRPLLRVRGWRPVPLRWATQVAEPFGSSWRELRVDLADPVTGLRAEVFYRILVGQGALRSWVRLSNQGREPVTVESVTSFLCGGLSGGRTPGRASGSATPESPGRSRRAVGGERLARRGPLAAQAAP